MRRAPNAASPARSRSSSKHRSLRRLGGRLALALLGPVVLFGLAEVGARLALPRPLYIPDEELLYRLDTEGAWQRKNATRINSRGYRGPEIDSPKPAGRLRVLALGGSTTFGYRLADAETWPILVEERFRAAGIDAEVVNGGVPGWGAQQCLRRLRQDGEWMDPDLVVLFSGWNWPVIDSARSPAVLPYDPSRTRHLPEALVQSRLFLLLCRELRGWRSHPPPLPASRAAGTSREELLAQQVREVDRWCRGRGIPLALVRYPALIGRSAQFADWAHFEALAAREHPDAGSEPDRVFRRLRRGYLGTLEALEAVAQELGTPLLDTTAPFESLDAGGRAALFMDCHHLTAEGNRILAAALAEELLGRPGFLPAPAGRRQGR